MTKPLDENGKELDANFVVEVNPFGFDIILESRGGGVRGPRPVRNGNYGPALTLLLERMANRSMVLSSVELASTQAAKIAQENRIFSIGGYPYPISLMTISSAEDLRLAVGRASALIGQRPGAKGGNSNKRLRLAIEWAHASRMSAAQIESLLALPAGKLPAAPAPETPTDDPRTLEERVGRVRAKLSLAPGGTLGAPPLGSTTGTRAEATISRFLRDPEVVAWVLENAEGVCESCEKSAPFLRSDGFPYLEVHHVRPLAEGGPDTVDNAIAVCPNCHRQFYHGAERTALRERVIATLARIIDHPTKVVRIVAEDAAATVCEFAVP